MRKVINQFAEMDAKRPVGLHCTPHPACFPLDASAKKETVGGHALRTDAQGVHVRPTQICAAYCLRLTVFNQILTDWIYIVKVFGKNSSRLRSVG